MIRVPRPLEDGAYVAVGFALLGFHRAQVARRAMEKRLPPEARNFAKAAGDLVGDVVRELPREASGLTREGVAFARFALQVLRAPTSRSHYP